MYVHVPSLPLCTPPQPTKHSETGELINYLAIETLEWTSEVQVTKKRTEGGQRAIVAIAADNSDVDGEHMVSIYEDMLSLYIRSAVCI